MLDIRFSRYYLTVPLSHESNPQAKQAKEKYQDFFIGDFRSDFQGEARQAKVR
jgi:hypothetical protein